MKVRVLSALLAFCLVLTMVPAVGAVDGVTASTPSARSEGRL